jgi:MFS family permease
MVMVGLGLCAASFAQSLIQVYAAYGLGVGLGVGCAYVPAIGAVQRWFLRRRGFASGLAVSGIGVGTLAMPPLATMLIASFGWRDAYLVLGALAVVVGGGAALLIENDPPRAAAASVPTATRPDPARKRFRQKACRCAMRSGRGALSCSILPA